MTLQISVFIFILANIEYVKIVSIKHNGYVLSNGAFASKYYIFKTRKECLKDIIKDFNNYEKDLKEIKKQVIDEYKKEKNNEQSR